MTYPLDKILPPCLLAVLAGAEAVPDIALLGCKKLELLRRFRPFKGGTPAHDHLGDTSRCSTPSNSSAASLPGLPR